MKRKIEAATNCRLVRKRRVANAMAGWLIFCLLVGLSACSKGGKGTSPGIVDGKPFQPSKNVHSRGGRYQIPSMNIQDGISVAFDGDVSLEVDGEAVINGAVNLNCAQFTMDVGGSFSLNGALVDSCTEPGKGGITFNLAPDQQFSFGESGEVNITTQGDLVINIGDVADKRVPTPLLFEPSANVHQPVCQLTADTLISGLDEAGDASFNLEGDCFNPDGSEVAKKSYRITQLASAAEWQEEFSREKTVVLHEPGQYLVSLEGGDDTVGRGNALITIAVLDPLAEEALDFAGAAIYVPMPYYEQGSQLELSALVEASHPMDELSFLWVMEINGETSAYLDQTPLISLDAPGVLNILLTLDEPNTPGTIARASSSVYVYPAGQSLSGLRLASLSTVPTPTYDTRPGPGKIGNTKAKVSSLTLRALPVVSTPIIIADNVTVEAGNGKSYAPANVRTGSGFLQGDQGGNGGSIEIFNYNGDVVVGNRVTLISGNGGNGQDAISTGKTGQNATARGGNGGMPGNILLGALDLFSITGVSDLFWVVVQGSETLVMGNGGDGGNATATGGNGLDDCNAPGPAGNATAIGGRGGNVLKRFTLGHTRVVGAGITLDRDVPSGKAGIAGKGGIATATGGNGGNALDPAGKPCNSNVMGRKGGMASAYGGIGGTAFLKVTGGIVVQVGFLGGIGGGANTTGGKGGKSSNCPERADGVAGGKGGDALALSGKTGDGFGPKTSGGPSIEGMTCKGGDGGDGGGGTKRGGPGGAGGICWSFFGTSGAAGAAGPLLGAEATATPQTTTQAPVITALEFPVGNVMDPSIITYDVSIPADGTTVDGWIHFRDIDGDVAYAQFTPLQKDVDFDPFGFYISDDFLEGNYSGGRIMFNLWCGTHQTVTLGITLKDLAGNWSENAFLTFRCE